MISYANSIGNQFLKNRTAWTT